MGDFRARRVEPENRMSRGRPLRTPPVRRWLKSSGRRRTRRPITRVPVRLVVAATSAPVPA